MSDTGRIVGTYGSPGQAAEFEANGDVAVLPIPAGYVRCRAVAVADDGTIAGTCFSPAASALPTTGFFAESARAALQFIPLDANIESTVMDMNNRGVILVTGHPATDGTISGSWTYDTATDELTELHGPPNSQVYASAINDPGDVLGIVSTRGPDGSRAREIAHWARDTRALTTVTTPGAVTIEDMNNQGGFVGGIAGSAVYWSSMTAPPEVLPGPPPRPGGVGSGALARGVNDEGWIVGRASYGVPWNDVAQVYGVAWTPDRRIIDLGDDVEVYAINASKVTVGARRGTAVRLDL
ncbi:MAG TPA: hypothetical protein VI072_34090 [Polyangiaceae bacterium]